MYHRLLDDSDTPPCVGRMCECSLLRCHLPTWLLIIFAVGVDGSQLLDSMSASDVINLMHRAGLFEEQGKEASDPKNIDASQPESAVRLEFVPSSQKWVKSSVKIKVAKVMFANGRRYGCILIKDLMEHEIVRVLKKRIDQIGGGLEDEEVLDLVQRQILGATTAKLFCAQAPHSCQPYFVNCHAYQLTNRPNQPMAFVEDLISIPNYKKKALFIKPATQGRDDVRESHRFAAFQYFGYYHSERQMVFDSAFHIDGVWTEPTVQSMDESLGGATNRGQKGIFAWEFEFEDTYSKLRECPAEREALTPGVLSGAPLLPGLHVRHSLGLCL